MRGAWGCDWVGMRLGEDATGWGCGRGGFTHLCVLLLLFVPYGDVRLILVGNPIKNKQILEGGNGFMEEGTVLCVTCFGAFGTARLESARFGSARIGSAKLGRLGSARARLGSARLGPARPGPARLCSARLGSARLVPARLGSARLCH